jgi:hypothetical protein
MFPTSKSDLVNTGDMQMANTEVSGTRFTGPRKMKSEIKSYLTLDVFFLFKGR